MKPAEFSTLLKKVGSQWAQSLIIGVTRAYARVRAGNGSNEPLGPLRPKRT